MKKILVIIVFCLFYQANAQKAIEIGRINPPKNALDGTFGSAVAISGNFAIVGASSESVITSTGDTLSGAGAAYVYRRGNSGKWRQTQRLIASNPIEANSFGTSVEISGDYAVIGTFSFFPSVTNSFVFKKNRRGLWEEVQVLISSDFTEGDSFGVSAAIEGDRLLVGAPGFNNLEGAIYEFRRNSQGKWVETQKLQAQDKTEGDSFGVVIDLKNNRAIVGVSSDNDDTDPTIEQIGSAYIFQVNANDAWEQVQKLKASDGMELDVFGAEVALSGNFAIVGAPREGDSNAEGSGSFLAGAVYVYELQSNNVWTEVQKITPQQRFDLAGFGDVLRADGDILIIGSTASLAGTPPEAEKGAVYVFKRQKGQAQWTEIQRIVPDEEISFFSAPLALQGDTFLAGGIIDEEFNRSIYTYKLFGKSPRTPKEEASQLTVYPAIAATQITLEAQKTNISQVNITDMKNGRQVESRTANDRIIVINVANFREGIYAVEATLSDGTTIKRRFIKQ